MTTPRIRMIAGPNGSGKTTLADYLRSAHALPLGHYLNPDELDQQICQSHQLKFDQWGVQVDSAELIAFIGRHPLGMRGSIRVLKGGHDVPREKILSRYHRSLSLLPECIGLAHRAFLFDNSGRAHAPVAEFENGNLVRLYEPLPGWFVREWLDRSG